MNIRRNFKITRRSQTKCFLPNSEYSYTPKKSFALLKGELSERANLFNICSTGSKATSVVVLHENVPGIVEKLKVMYSKIKNKRISY